jgi:hypothetical protein
VIPIAGILTFVFSVTPFPCPSKSTSYSVGSDVVACWMAHLDKRNSVSEGTAINSSVYLTLEQQRRYYRADRSSEARHAADLTEQGFPCQIDWTGTGLVRELGLGLLPEKIAYALCIGAARVWHTFEHGVGPEHPKGDEMA